MESNSKKYLLQGSSNTTRLIHIVHGSLCHISQTTEQSSFTFRFTFQTHQIRNNIQISIVYIVFIILDLVVLDISFGYTSWFIRNFFFRFMQLMNMSNPHVSSRIGGSKPSLSPISSSSILEPSIPILLLNC